MSRPWVPIKEVPKPENISGYRPYRMDAQPGDWLTYEFLEREIVGIHALSVKRAGRLRGVRKNPHENTLHDLNKTGPFRDRIWCMLKQPFFHAVDGIVGHLKSGG